MKKIIVLLLIVAASVTAYAQTNFQLHYDFGQGRQHLTSTVEMFKPDAWGNTFLFVDMDYNGGDKNHPSAAYFEIARCLKFWDGPFSAQVEYNGGLFNMPTQIATLGLPINNAFLAGVDYQWNDESFSKIINLKVLYKYISDKNPASFQLTGVWNLHFMNRKLTFSGFADFWREDNTNFTDAQGNAITPTDTKFVFLSEPQLWYNVNEHFSAGGELEIATNFGAVNGLKFCPTLALKWNF